MPNNSIPNWLNFVNFFIEFMASNTNDKTKHAIIIGAVNNYCENIWTY